MNLAALSLREYVSDQLRDLCEVVDIDDETPLSLLREVLGPVGDRALSDPPMWPSDVADDHTPIEFSIAFDDSGRPALRVLGETIGKKPSVSANLRAARHLLDVLADRFELSLDRFHEVQDLFLPEEPQGTFAMWFSFVFRSDSPSAFKIYFNPGVRGPEQAPELIAEALRRLGLDSAYPTVAKHSIRHGLRDRFSFFALDLHDQPLSRVQVYVSRDAAESSDVELAASVARGADPELVRKFYSLVSGGSGPLTGRALTSSYTFVEGDSDLPINYSLHLPIREYVTNDELARERVLAFMAQCNIDSLKFDRALDAVSRRSLRDGVGLIAYVTLRLGLIRSGITVYLSSEAYGVTPPRPRQSDAPLRKFEVV